MFDILTLIPGKKKTTQSGWHSFNALCCHHRGHNLDKRYRGGIKFDGDNNWSYHCFNCNFTCNFVLGRTINKNTRILLKWCGLDDSQISKYNLESMQQKDLLQYIQIKKKKFKVKFKEVKLPESELLDINNNDHVEYIEYLNKRGIQYNDYPFMVTPTSEGRNKHRIIIPYTYENKIVGHISRYLDNSIPKYIKEQQQGYVFGTDLQKKEYEVCLVFEGVFDALPFNGCALLHDDISNEQAELLKNLNKQIIVVPDRDKTGLTVCNKALELGFSVSLPDWHDDVKDASDALVKYGRLPTLLSILRSATNSKIKIDLIRKKIAKRL